MQVPKKRLLIVPNVSPPANILHTAYTLTTLRNLLDRGRTTDQKKENAMQVLANWGLIANSRNCDGPPPCVAGPMCLRKKSDIATGYIVILYKFTQTVFHQDHVFQWRCTTCNHAIGVRSESIFEHQHVSITQSIILLYYWSNLWKTSMATIKQEVGVSDRVITTHYRFFREITQHW